MIIKSCSKKIQMTFLKMILHKRLSYNIRERYQIYKY